MHHSFDAPRRHRTASIALVIALIVGLFALVAPTTPAGAGGATAPGVPTFVSIVPGDGFATLTWTAPSDGGSPITQYLVNAYVNGSFATGRPYFNADTTQVLSPLTNGVTYQFSISATNAVGGSPESELSAPVTIGSVPGAPTAVTATGATGGVVEVSWTAPARNGGYPIDGYEIVASRFGNPVETIETAGAGTTASVDGLIAGRFYNLAVRARNIRGYGPYSDTSVEASPSTSIASEPQFVEATPGDRSIRVDWGTPEFEGGLPITGYELSLYDAATFTLIDEVVVVTGQSYTFAAVDGLDLRNGVGYLIFVSALNDLGEGLLGQVAATPVGPPGPPVNVGAFAGNGQVTVAWTPPSNDGGSPVTGYRVTPFIGAAAQTARTFDANSTSQVITGLTNGTSYTFKVAAINETGTGVDSAASPAVTPGTAPGAPTGVTATGGNGRATVSWTAPTATGGAPLIGYRVTPFIGAAPQTVRSFPSTATSQVVTGLTNGTAYTFRVSAFNAIDNGPDSAASAPVTPAPVAPGAPTGVAATGGNAQATVTWTAPADTGGSPVTGYRVTPFIGGVAQSPRTFTSTATSQVITGLTNGTAYTFRVAATTSAGTGANSAASAAVTPAPVVPGAPTGVTAVAGNGQVVVSWTAPSSNGGSAITDYVVRSYVGGVQQAAYAAVGTSVTVLPLTNGTSYTFQVQARNGVGLGPLSASSSAVTPQAEPPGAPTGVGATTGNGQATVSWTAPASDGGSVITGYRVTPFVGGVAQTARTFASTATSQVITGLTNGTAYTFKVAATNAVGTGADSAASAAVTPGVPATVPGAPTAVTASAQADGSVAVEWTPPVSTGGSPLTGFRITPFLGATAQTAVTLSSGTATGSFVTGLRRGTTYTFKVAAINAVGTGADSVASAPVTTPAAWAPHPSADSFTRAQFLAFAGRQPTAAELTSWRTALQNQTQTAAQLIETLFTATYWDGTLGPIVRLYRAVYLRDPDLGGLRYWEGQIRSRRQSLNQIANFFAVSPEFRTLYGSLGNQAFVTKVYELVLGRAPSASDLTYWTGELNRGQPRGRMVLLFSSSAEYKSRTANRVTAILVRYGLLAAVGPRATTDAATAVIADQGGSPLRLITEVLASPQYAARL